MNRLLALALLLLTPTLASGQNFGPANEEKTDSLTYRGVEANAQTRPENHTMNRNPRLPGWGGCVPSSVRTAALHAGIPRDQIDHFWAIAQERVGVGGTGPELLAQMVREAFPGEKWTSYLGSNPADVRRVLDTLSGQGHVLSATMGWGELYGPGRRIAHYVNVDHFSSEDDLACVEDNNDPAGVYRWMPSSEYLARCLSGGQAWIFSFERLPVVVQLAALFLFAATILLLASSLALLGWWFIQLLEPRPSCTPSCS